MLGMTLKKKMLLQHAALPGVELSMCNCKYCVNVFQYVMYVLCGKQYNSCVQCRLSEAILCSHLCTYPVSLIQRSCCVSSCSSVNDNLVN